MGKGDGRRWRAWVRAVHSPVEVALRRKVGGALRESRAEMLDALDALPASKAWWSSRRDVIDDVLHALFGVDVATILGAAARAAVRRALVSGFASGATAINRPALEWASARVDAVTDQQLASMVTRVDLATKARLRALVVDTLDQGGTIADLQARIQIDEAFSPVRSLRIARTETTRSTNAGSRAAWQEVHDVEGLTVRRRWLAEIDGATRRAHVLLHGQEQSITSHFVVPSGEYAGEHGLGPGEFPSGGMVINCRCTTVPIVKT
jgi:hypothetical protein